MPILDFDGYIVLKLYQCSYVTRKSFVVVMINNLAFCIEMCLFFSPGFMPNKSKLRVGPLVLFLLEESSKSKNEITLQEK